MKVIKVLVGCFCLGVALLIAIAIVINPQFPMDLPLTIGDAGMAFIGGWLLLHRNQPMLRRTRRLFILAATMCGVFLLGVGLPYFIRSRGTCCGNACVNNLRQIDAAANEFALVNHKNAGDPIHFPDDLTPYIKLNSQGKIPGCPHGGVYHLNKVGETPTCSLGTSITPAHVLP